MNKKGMIVKIVVVLVMILILGWIFISFFNSGGNSDSSSRNSAVNNGDDSAKVIKEITGSGNSEESATRTNQVNDEPERISEVKKFSMIAKQWVFEPEIITVNKGDTVRLLIESIDVDHGFGLSSFGINERLKSGETVEVEFVADKVGEFSFRCTVSCGSGHGGMDGKLVVEE